MSERVRVGAGAGGVGRGAARSRPGRSWKRIPAVRAAANRRGPSGTYWIDPDGGNVSNAVRVYCDVTADGGGWTQVANTRNYTLNDQGGGYYSDISSVVPSGQHYSIWNGMRAYVSANSDIRFTCKLDRSARGHDVALSFYDNHWYRVIPPGSDAPMCLESYNGPGSTPPAPPRSRPPPPITATPSYKLSRVSRCTAIRVLYDCSSLSASVTSSQLRIRPPKGCGVTIERSIVLSGRWTSSSIGSINEVNSFKISAL